ncbi:hypothetical protein Tco_1492297 [Tanacetum coccineum]
METIHVQFDELTQMASKQHGSGPEIQGMTSGHIGSGLVQNHAALTSTKPPPSTVFTTFSATTLLLSDTSEASSSTTIDYDAPSPSTSPNNETTTTLIHSTNVEEPNEEEDAEFDSDTFKNHLLLQPPAQLTMQEGVHEFERLEVQELVPRPSNLMLINLKWIFKVKLDEYGGVLKNKAWTAFQMDVKTAFLNGILKEEVYKYGLDQCDAVDIPMVERSKLDEDPNGTPVDPTRYRSKAYQKAPYYGKIDADHVGCQDSKKSTSGSAQFRGEKLVNWSSRKQSVLTKHIAVRYHFIKKQVKNEIVELDFVKTAYQLADIFTKALARERFEFLINCIGMQSITPEELKHLTKSDEE